MGLAGMATGLAYNTTVALEEAMELRSSGDRASFQWGGTVSALFLLALNRTGRRSVVQGTLLVLFLFTSFPTVLFKILRGQFGYWIAFLAVAAHLFFPTTFPVSRFILFVITPDWVTDGLRDSIAGCVFCLLIGILLVITEVRGIGGFENCECNLHCFGFCLGIALLFFFTILYICRGAW